MKYVTFSYDDNSYLNHRLVEIFNQYGARCTFNLNSGMIVPGKIANFFLGSRKMVSLDDLKELLKDTPHEIACHGEKHLDISKLSPEDMRNNIKNDKASLERIFERKMNGFIYPYGNYNEETTKALEEYGFHYTRTTVPTHKFDVPKDFLIWNPTCHHNDKELFNLAEKFINLKGDDEIHIFYVWGHSFEYGVFKNWDRLIHLLEILKKDSSIEYLTNEEIYERVRSR